MKQKRNKSSAFAALLVRRRWSVVVLGLLVAVVAGAGVTRLAFDNDYRIFFSDENPQLRAYEELQRKYTKIDNIMFAVGSQDGEQLTNEILAGVEELTARAWSLPYVLRVDALTNYQHTTAFEDDLVVQDLVEGALAMSGAERERLLATAHAQPALQGRLISEDGTVTGVNATFEMPGESLDEGARLVAAARDLEQLIEAKYPVDVHLTGMVMLNNAFFEASMRDMTRLVPVMYFIIILVTYLLLRSISATIGTLVVLLLSTATAMGLAGWIGIPLTPPSSAAPTIILTLAVADSIHILMTLLGSMRRGTEKRAAIVESLRQNLQPVILTSVTTAVGFLSLNFSDSPPFAHLGNITALGIMAALFYSAVFLPAYLSLVPLRPKPVRRFDGFDMGVLADFVTRNRRRVLAGSALVAAVLLAFLPANEFNDDFVGYFDEGTTFRQSVDYTSENLTGVYQVQYSLDSGENNGVAEPEFLAEVAAFTGWLRAQPEVRHVASISDVFKRLNKNLHGDDETYYRLPESRELAAQYLLLYELSLPFGLDLNNQLNVDKSSTQVTVTVDDMSSAELREFAQRGEAWLSANVGLEATGIGPAVMFAYISDRNVSSMLLGTFLAVLVISGILVVALRSVRLGLLSLLPNVLPAAMAFGLWGLLRGEVNMAVSMVSGMTLGIVVDDTIHFLSKYLRGRRENGLAPQEAVRYAMSNVGRAIVMTSVILVAGFSVLAQSSFGMNSSMAILTAIAIVLALAADLLPLPALLLVVDRERTPETVTEPLSEASGAAAAA